MPRTAYRRTRLAAAATGVLTGLLVLSACGGSEPEPLKPMQPEVPADLCAAVPTAAKTGLVSNSDSDTTGNPTAACSLRSPDGSKSQVRAVVTWVQLDDDVTADSVLASQCRSVDRTEFKVQTGFTAQGADKACAAAGSAAGTDSSTMAAAKDRDVVTVRYTAVPPGTPAAAERAKQMLEGVLSSVAGPSPGA
jgi:hypothetical protein